VNNFSSCIICKICGPEQPYWLLKRSFSRKLISLHMRLGQQHLESWWRYVIVSAENRNAARNIPGSSSHMWIACGKRPSHICISALPTGAIHISSPINKSKPVKPISFYLCICLLYLPTIQEMDSDEHIVLARGSCVHNLHNLWSLTTYLRKKWLVYLFRYMKEFFWFQ